MEIDLIFRDLLKNIEQVLNGEPLLVHLVGLIEIDNPTSIFDQLLDHGIYNSFLQNSLDCQNSITEDSKCFFQKGNLPILSNANESRFEFLELNQKEFEDALLTTISNSKSKFGNLISAYGTYLETYKAKKIVGEVVSKLGFQNNSNWSFYWYNASTFDLILDKQEFYFWRLGADCCLVFHDNESNYYTLFTTGTD